MYLQVTYLNRKSFFSWRKRHAAGREIKAVSNVATTCTFHWFQPDTRHYSTIYTEVVCMGSILCGVGCQDRNENWLLHLHTSSWLQYYKMLFMHWNVFRKAKCSAGTETSCCTCTCHRNTPQPYQLVSQMVIVAWRIKIPGQLWSPCLWVVTLKMKHKHKLDWPQLWEF